MNGLIAGESTYGKTNNGARNEDDSYFYDNYQVEEDQTTM
jgi:hypothetical protein